MSIQLRCERHGDEDAIDAVNCRAFASMNEANIVRLMRMYSPAFDRRYSVTAWDSETLVGHVLFTPPRLRLMGEGVPALAVGPVAVMPEWQRRGIGGELLRFGHELGRGEGFAFAFLLGHPSYYPRHGYRACHGFGKATLDANKLPAATRKFHRMPVRPADVPWLVERHFAEWADVDFGWLWGTCLSEWTIPCMNATVWWTEDGRRAAYTVAKPRRGFGTLLADDAELAREVIAAARPATLDHHPSGWLARHVLCPEWATVEAKRSDAAMALELQPGVLDAYLEAVEAGTRPVGSTLFPLPFLAC